MRWLLYRYIAKEILVPFLLGLAAFNGILLVGRLLKLASLMVSSNIPFTTVLSLLGHLLPSFSLITIPMSFLLAVLVAFGRLSGDSEIVAMKAAGLSLRQLLPPVCCLALLCSVVTLTVSLTVLPASARSFRELLASTIQHGASLVIRDGVFNDRIPGVTLYCASYDEQQNTMRGILIQDERSAREPLTIFATSGAITPTPDGSALQLALAGGSIHGQGRDRDYRLVAFDRYRMQIPLPQKKATGSNEEEMPIGELLANIKAGSGTEKLRRDMQQELHERFAFPLSCLIFAPIGMALGIQNQRSGKGSGFTLSLAIFVCYYVILSIAKTLGQKGALHPGVAIWIPNLLFLVLGLALFRLTSHESRLNLTGIVRRAATRFTRRRRSHHAPH